VAAIENYACVGVVAFTLTEELCMYDHTLLHIVVQNVCSLGLPASSCV
jgi:hypothetical protein